MIHVPDAEVHFRVDDYSDATSARSPVIYISPNDIYATHSLIHDNLDIIVRSSTPSPPSSPVPSTPTSQLKRKGLTLIVTIRSQNNTIR